MTVKITNNASTTLASSISASAGTITVATGTGSLFPVLAAGDYFYATLVDSSNNLEIVKVTARSGDVMTATRAQDGTTAKTYSAGAKFELHPTAGVINDILTNISSVSTAQQADAANITSLQSQVTALQSGPVFSVYPAAAQSIPAGVDTKVAFNTEVYDPNNCFNTSNYRFTPNVAGYYQINAAAQVGALTQGYIIIYKNGAPFRYGNFGSASTSPIFTVSANVQMNGTTDYLEIFIYSSASGNISNNSTLTYFDGCLVRKT